MTRATIGIVAFAVAGAAGEAINASITGSALISILFSLIIFCLGAVVGGSLVEYIEDDK